MVLDHAGITPNVARDKVAVEMPREERAEIVPPTAEHVLAVHDVLPTRYRLPLLTLDATGMRLSELEGLTWGDVDEPRGAWRVSAAVSKTRHARWVASSANLRGGARPLPAGRSDRRSGRSYRVTATTGSEPPSRVRVPRRRPTFSPMICAIAASAFCTRRRAMGANRRARRAANLAVTANTYSHVLAAEDEARLPELLG